MLIAYPATGEQDSATDALVNRISGAVLPAATRGTGIRAYVTGPNAANVSFANLIGKRLWWLVAVVVLLSMLLLLVMFRSVTIAVKAAVMNLLSLSAAFGVLTLVTQDGLGRQLFGFPERMPVTTWVPVFLFVILFGLSMDYEVFLLSRIREAYDATGDNSGSVARGLASTARVISAAAAIMIVVFLTVVLGANASVKQVGLGLAVAVLIDATIVRLVLVPAAMELLGKANWWLPRPLARILPDASRHGDEPPARRPGLLPTPWSSADGPDATLSLREDHMTRIGGLYGPDATFLGVPSAEPVRSAVLGGDRHHDHRSAVRRRDLAPARRQVRAAGDQVHRLPAARRLPAASGPRGRSAGRAQGGRRGDIEMPSGDTELSLRRLEEAVQAAATAAPSPSYSAATTRSRFPTPPASPGMSAGAGSR